MVPLAMLLPDEEVHRCNARGDTTVCALATRVEKKLTLPVEPKVNICTHTEASTVCVYTCTPSNIIVITSYSEMCYVIIYQSYCRMVAILLTFVDMCIRSIICMLSCLFLSPAGCYAASLFTCT